MTKEYLYWDEDPEVVESTVEGYLGKAPAKMARKKSGTRVDRLYAEFKKLSSKEQNKFINLTKQSMS